MGAYYIKRAYRNVKKNKVLTFAKLIGLTISIAIVLFAFGYVYYETGFDRFIQDQDKIFRCLMIGKLNNNDADFSVTSPEMAKIIAKEIPEVKETLRVKGGSKISFIYKNKPYNFGKGIFVDSNFFSFFDLPLTLSRKNPLQTAHNILISKTNALKYFGSVDEAIGKVVGIRGDDFTISGVFEDFPKNFHLQYQVLFSLERTNPDEAGWGSQSYHTYIKTHSANVDIDELGFKVSKSVYTHWNDQVDGASAQNWEDLKGSDATYLFFPVEPLKDVHFSNHKFDIVTSSNKFYVYGAIILAVLVLLISSFNYLNLTIADISTRMREIGIYKTNGAVKSQIASQFLFEAFLYWGISFILAIVLYDYVGKPLANYLSIDIYLSRQQFLKISGICFIVITCFNLLVAYVPISFFSGKKVLSLIRTENGSRGFISVKSSFIFFQFVLSALIIFSSLFVFKQVNYLVKRERGYNPENVIMASIWELNEKQRKVFIDELNEFAPIKSVSSSNTYFGQDPSMNGAFYERIEDETYFHTSTLWIDDNFFETFNIRLKEGRNFDRNRKSDFQKAIINETAAREYKKRGSLIGKKLLLNGNNYEIIGIVRDFNYRSLHHKLLPLVMMMGESDGNIFIKVNNGQIARALAILDKQWKKFDISKPLDYEFHDEVLARHYQKDQQAKKLLLFLSIISITIACIGLYAISYFIIVKKTKEIGVRKVNGAKEFGVIVMLNFDFLKWVVIAFVTATPIAYFIMKGWLGNFAYKTELSWWIFALADILTIVIAILTVSWQSWLAARKNPVEALRYE